MKKHIKRKLSNFGTVQIVAVICVVALFTATLIYEFYYNKKSVPTFNEGYLYATFIDVGQGDSTLITTPTGEHILVDCGPASSEDILTDFLDDAGVETIDYLILSHPHEDHIGGGISVLENFNVKRIIMPEVTSNTNVFTNLLKAAEKECSEMILAKPDTQHYIGDCTITVYGPLDTDQQDLNNSSIVCKIAYNQTSILFTGDAEEQTEKKLVKEYGNELNCTMLKVAHHGSSSSSSPRFLDTCNPQIAVISCAEDNEYGHPHTEVLERLNQRNIEYYRTDIDHTVSFICDGNTVTKQ